MNTATNNNVVQKLGLASYEMSVSINLAQRAFRELLKTCLGHHGLTIPQWTLLGKLYVAGSIRPVSVAQFLGIKPPYVAKLISTLEEQKLITSEQFPDDGRGKAITLTLEGKALVDRVEGMLEACLNEQLGGLKHDDLKTYFMLTQYIAQNVRHHS